MNELLKVTTNEQQEPCISGRELHKFFWKLRQITRNGLTE